MYSLPRCINRVRVLLLCLVVFPLIKCDSDADAGQLSTNGSYSSLPLERTERFISYPVSGGIAKVLFGFLAPVRFMHPLPRSLNCGVNLQANYVISPNIIFPRPESVFMNRALEERPDRRSRAQVYGALEKLLRVVLGAGGRARECLLRTVCEVADTPLSHNGLVGELMDVVLTPHESDALPPEFLLARRYGANGVDCARVFSGCPGGIGLLDSISTTML